MELSEEHQVKAQPFASEKLYQGRHHPLRTFFHQPAPSVLQNEESHVGRQQLHLRWQEVTIGFFASNREHRQGEPGLRKLRKIAGGLLERNEVGSARAHASRLGVGLGAPVRFRDKVCFYRRRSRSRNVRSKSACGPAPALQGWARPCPYVVQIFCGPNCLEPPNSAVVAS